MSSKKDYILDKADLVRVDNKSELEAVEPKRRAVMTSDNDEAFIKKYYSGRTDCFRALLRDDKIKKGWTK